MNLLPAMNHLYFLNAPTAPLGGLTTSTEESNKCTWAFDTHRKLRCLVSTPCELPRQLPHSVIESRHYLGRQRRESVLHLP